MRMETVLRLALWSRSRLQNTSGGISKVLHTAEVADNVIHHVQGWEYQVSERKPGTWRL